MYKCICIYTIYIYTYIYIFIYIYINFLDYLKKISIQINVATDEGNSRNEIGQRANDEIRVAVQSWL